MARKRNRPAEKRHPALAEPVGAAGGRAAFAAGVLALLAAGGFFMPWYADSKEVLLSGFDLLRTLDDAPYRLRDGFALVGGRAFLVGLLMLYAALAVMGFAPAAARRLAGRALPELMILLVVASFVAGLFLMLILLNMNVAPHVTMAGHLIWALLLGMGLVVLLALMAIDREAGRADEGAMAPGEWGLWLGGLVATAFINYVWVCYGLVPRAEEAVRDMLRQAR